ncbi:MAG: phosphonopyruvate decarboxylase, partial [Clostridia bacterium]|nr:phosphonopyruvate decarboxylase [Clostridia bacterium]
VGSMGHSSSIALAIALAKPESRVVCIDGDGAMLMHLGAVPVIGELAPENLVHVVIKNGAHDTVGGEPVALKKCDVTAFPKASGYGLVTSACSEETLRAALETVKNFKGTAFLEVRTANGARKDLGRPTLTARQNVEAFREFLKK